MSGAIGDLIAEQYQRVLAGLSPEDPWPGLEASGFLDILRSEADGGAGLDLEGFFPLVLESGRWPGLQGVIEAMTARIEGPEALTVACVAGQMVGSMEVLGELTLDYATTRKQFGREIGKFQAIQHQLAVMAEEVLAARMAAQSAFVGDPRELSSRRAGAAKARAGEAAVAVSAIAHAVHGAIGVSQEHPLHHYTRALRQWRYSHGGDSHWAQRLGIWALSGQGDFVTLARTL